MRYIIDCRDNRVMHVCGSHYASVRETMAFQKQRERAAEIYRKIGRQIPNHFDYVLATVESPILRGRGEHFKSDEFTIITKENRVCVHTS